jgi:hypothetical protein
MISDFSAPYVALLARPQGRAVRDNPIRAFVPLGHKNFAPERLWIPCPLRGHLSGLANRLGIAVELPAPRAHWVFLVGGTRAGGNLPRPTGTLGFCFPTAFIRNRVLRLYWKFVFPFEKAGLFLSRGTLTPSLLRRISGFPRPARGFHTKPAPLRQPL